MQEQIEPGGADQSSVQNKRLLVINTGYAKKRFIFQRLKKLGLHLIVLNKEKNWADQYVNEWIFADTTKHEEALAKVADYLKDHKIDGVITFWEDDVLLTAKIVEKYHLVGIPYSVAVRARNKLAFRTFCEQEKLPTPKAVKVEDFDHLVEATKDFHFPVVIKPAFGASSAYVIKVEKPEELPQIARYIHKSLSTEIESSLTDGTTMFVEEYIDGDEVDLDILLQNGKFKYCSITDNFPTVEPFFIETGESTPTILPQHAQQQLVSMAELVLEKLGVMNACVHFEAKYTDKGPMPIEVNLRMGGDNMHLFNKVAWHVDLIDQAVKIALGIYIPMINKPEEPFSYLAATHFLPAHSGVLSKVEIPQGFPENSHVKEFHFFKEVGDAVLVPPDGYEDLGWVAVTGKNINDARDTLENVRKLFTYEVVPFNYTSSVGKTVRSGRFGGAALKPELVKNLMKMERIKRITTDDLKKLNIAVACNEYAGGDGNVEQDLTSVGKNIQKTLNERGYKTFFLDFNNLDATLKRMSQNNIDLIFNVCERINDSSLLEPHVASLFDIFQLPYTGSSPFTLGLCIDKIRVKKLLTYHNIPTSKWDYAYTMDDDIRTDLRYPLIVKPANTDNSIGITNNSVVTNPQQLQQQLEYVISHLGRPALVEEYIEGDEYDVSILGSEYDDLVVLPLSRTIFSRMPKGHWNIYPFDAKFGDTDDFGSYVDVERPPKKLSKKLQSLITEIALDTYNILDCHDYGRVEIKVDKENNPYVLELNPNPSINIGDCVPTVYELMTGKKYGDFLEEIIRLAIKRYQNKPSYSHLQSNVM